jgi:ABC-type dipeptide/oligopeptide/nickel transport system permease subunit
LQFIEASHSVGASSLRIILKDILPNIIGPIIVYATLSLGEAILGSATLSFLGLGAQPPIPEWGAMLNEAQRFIRIAPNLSIFPGIAILMTVLGFNLLGDGIRDILDPKSKR